MPETTVEPAPWEDAVRLRRAGYYLIYSEPEIVNGQLIIVVLIMLESESRLLRIQSRYGDALQELAEQGFEAVGPESRIPKFEEPAAWREATIETTGVEKFRVPAAFIVRLAVTERCPWRDQVSGISDLVPTPPLAAFADRKMIDVIDDPEFRLPVRQGQALSTLIAALSEATPDVRRLFTTFREIARHFTIYDLIHHFSIDEATGTELMALFGEMGLDLRVV